MFRRAGQAEILRSNQKDEFYISYLRSALSETFQSVVGMRSWIHFRKELEVFADFTYFLLTTAAGFQTLGEEYVNIIQVDSTLRASVSTMIQFSLKPKTRFGIFWLLGWLTASQLLGGVLISVYQFHKTLQDLKSKVISSPLSICKVKSVATASSHQCPLCLELRHETTVTPCGHLFCWNCILEWCQTKGECPLCREKLLSCRLIYLQNYDF
ncbi:peroxisome biogenesis factor 10 isoform X3 [Octopus bimaculoides]|uniref:peroxisome biogenesis factor 10 isoform X3 n=1 Tax=Octopus bimaculoides TaxID=37653 RepID=UPI0022E8A09B|nr:peroxisome biogenesis factor 10 isoform X3 [Octopus bimaculoides]